jgi:hypothetical protein
MIIIYWPSVTNFIYAISFNIIQKAKDTFCLLNGNYFRICFILYGWIRVFNMGLDFVSGQYGCLFSRCRKYVINSLIHWHFHIGLVIILRPILTLDCVSGQYGGFGMITRPILAWDEVEAHVDPGQYGPRYGNDLVVIQ